MLKRSYTALILLIAGAWLLSACAAPILDTANYTTTMLSHLQRTLGVLGNIQTLASSPRLEDPSWQSEIQQETAALRTLIAEARAITPPEQAAGAHASYLDTMQSLESLAATVDQAVALRDSAQLQEALRLLNEARRMVEEARRTAQS